MTCTFMDLNVINDEPLFQIRYSGFTQKKKREKKMKKGNVKEGRTERTGGWSIHCQYPGRRNRAGGLKVRGLKGGGGEINVCSN